MKNMKRIIAIVLTLAAVLSMAVIGVSAVTKADLLTEAAKSPVYKYVRVAFENAARTIEITDEQAAELLPVVKKACTVIGDNSKGHGGYYSAKDGHVYTAEEYKAVMACIDEACKILGFTYKMEPVKNAKHVGDVMFVVYNAQGKMVFLLQHVRKQCPCRIVLRIMCTARAVLHDATNVDGDHTVACSASVAAGAMV